MKGKIIALALLAAVVLSTGLVLAEEEEKQEPTRRGRRVGPVEEKARRDLPPGERGRRVGPEDRPREGVRRRPGMEEGRNPEEMFRQQMERRRQDQTESLGELKKILAMAKEENAPKTAAMLEKLIAKREQVYAERDKRMEEMRKRREEMMQRRGDRPEARDRIRRERSTGERRNRREAIPQERRGQRRAEETKEQEEQE